MFLSPRCARNPRSAFKAVQGIDRAMAWAVPCSGSELIVPFELSEAEEIMVQSLDDQCIAESSVSQTQELPVLTHLLKSTSCTTTSPAISVNNLATHKVGTSPKVTNTVRLHPVSTSDGYKLVVVPNTTAGSNISWTPHPWYHSTASYASGTPVALPGSPDLLKGPPKVVQLAPQSKTFKQQFKILPNVTPATKTVTIAQHITSVPGKPTSGSGPVVVIGKERDATTTVLHRSLHQSASLDPEKNQTPTSSDIECITRSTSALSSPAESYEIDDDTAMPIITSVMSLSNCDFDSIVDNAGNAENDKQAAKTGECLDSARSASGPASLLIKKIFPTHRVSGSHSLLVRQSAGGQDSVSATQGTKSIAKAIPRILAHPGTGSRRKTLFPTSAARGSPLSGFLPVSKACSTGAKILTGVSACKPARKVEGECGRTKNNKVEVFELDAVKKVGNTIMGSTITFKPSSELGTGKQSESQRSMIQKLQQAINCFEQSALKSDSTFNKVERNMLESVLSQLKDKTTEMNVSKKMNVPVTPKVEAKASKDGPKEHQNLSSSTTTNKKPMRRIVITSDTVPSADAHVIKEGIEAFLQRNNISNDFTEDEVLNLHWDGKDISTLYRKLDEQYVPPTTMLVEKEEKLTRKHSPHAPKPADVAISQDVIPKLEFKPRIIRVIKKNGQVIEQPLADSCPALPVVATSLSAKPVLHSSPDPTVTQAVTVSHAPSSCFQNGIRVSPTVGTSRPPNVVTTSQAVIASQPLQTLLNSMMNDTHPGEKKKQYVTAVFPDGQTRKIAISAIHVRKEAGSKSEVSSVAAPEVAQEIEVQSDCVPRGEKTSREMPGGDLSEASSLPSRSDDELSKMLEPEVLLEESNVALNFSESSSTISKQSSSDSSYSCNSDSDDSEEEEYVTVRIPVRRSGGRAAGQSQKQPRAKGRRQPSRQLWGEHAYRKRRRARTASRRNKQSKVEEEAADIPAEPIWARLRNATAKVVVNCRNCIDNPCIVLMDRLNDEVVKSGRVNLAEINGNELFSLSTTSKVVLSSTRIVEAVKVEPFKTNEEQQIEEMKKPQEDDIMQLLLDSRKQLEELRKKYQ